MRKARGSALAACGVAISVLLYLGGLYSPALAAGAEGSQVASGMSLLLQGWRGLAAGYPEWLANPLLCCAWVAALRARERVALGCALPALALMLGFLLRQRLQLPAAHLDLPLARHERGYWLWVASAVTMAASAALNWRLSQAMREERS